MLLFINYTIKIKQVTLINYSMSEIDKKKVLSTKDIFDMLAGPIYSVEKLFALQIRE